MARRRTNKKPASSDEEALHAAIIQFPDEDTPRLAYADLVEENGDADRAEFIRLQVKLAAADGAHDFPSEVRVAELYKRHRAEWESEFRGRAVDRVQFDRGFVTTVDATADAFIRYGESWCRRHPLRGVVLRKVLGRIEGLWAAPHLDAVRALTVRDYFGDEHLFAMTDAPRPGGTARHPNLETLAFAGDDNVTEIGTPGVEVLAGWDLPRLRGLSFADTDVDNRGAAAVAGAPWFANLESLAFETSRIGDAGLSALLEPPRRALAALELSWCRVTARGLHALADAPGGTALQELSLRENPVRAVRADRLRAVFQNYPRLWLNLYECPIPRTARAKLLDEFGGRVSVGRSDDANPDEERLRQLGAVAEAWGLRG